MLLLTPSRTKPEQTCTCKSPGHLIRDVESDSVGLGWGSQPAFLASSPRRKMVVPLIPCNGEDLESWGSFAEMRAPTDDGM